MGCRSLLLFLFLVSAVAAVQAQGVMTVSGAPFTATWTAKVERTRGIEIIVAEVARASDGSVYQARTVDGKIQSVAIDDVPNERRISLSVPTNTCEVSTPPGRPYWVVRTVAQQRAVLEHWHAEFEKGFDRKGPEISKHETAMGTKVEDGMTVFGQHYVHTRNSDGSVVSEGETWQTDLGFVISQTSRQVDPKTTSTSELKDIHRGEPDPKLFQLPVACVSPQHARH